MNGWFIWLQIIPTRFLGLFHLLFFCRESSFRSIHISLSISLLIDSPSWKKLSDWKDERDATNWMWNTIHDKTGWMKCVHVHQSFYTCLFFWVGWRTTQLLCKWRRVNNWCFWPHTSCFLHLWKKKQSISSLTETLGHQELVNIIESSKMDIRRHFLVNISVVMED